MPLIDSDQKPRVLAGSSMPPSVWPGRSRTCAPRHSLVELGDAARGELGRGVGVRDQRDVDHGRQAPEQRQHADGAAVHGRVRTVRAHDQHAGARVRGARRDGGRTRRGRRSDSATRERWWRHRGVVASRPRGRALSTPSGSGAASRARSRSPRAHPCSGGCAAAESPGRRGGRKAVANRRRSSTPGRRDSSRRSCGSCVSLHKRRVVPRCL